MTAAVPGDVEQEVINEWCNAQLHPWLGRAANRNQIMRDYIKLNATSGSVYLFRFFGNSVSVESKLHLDNPNKERLGWLAPRFEAYTAFFREVAQSYYFEEEVHILVDLEDNPAPRGFVPIFSFQKGAGDDFILLPDTDMLTEKFHEGDIYTDRTEYCDKKCAAVFVGSTSGSLHTEASVRLLTNERLAAAAYFDLFDEVDFRLPNIVQFADQDARQAIAELGHGQGAMSWRDQFAYKFILSCDGNGATCSRVAISLASNSVLLKYDSKRILHYFSSMIPWRHYIPISEHGDVINIVAREKNDPGVFQDIANQGREFAERYLNRNFLARYTFYLIQGFGHLLNGTPKQSDLRVESTSHVHYIGDIEDKGAAPWIGRPRSGLPLEAFALSATDAGVPVDFCYRTYSSDLMPSQWHSSGEEAGHRGENNRIYGVDIIFGDTAAERYDALLCVTYVGNVRSLAKLVNKTCSAHEPRNEVESFQLILRRRPMPAVAALP